MGGCLSASNVPVEEPAPASSRADTSKYDSQLDDIKADILADGNLPMTVVRMHSHMETPIEEIYAGVHDGPVLGDGVSGIVRKVKHRSTGVEYAVKRLDLSLVKQGHEGLNALREEIVITCQMDHPNVVRLEEAYESDTEIYLIQQLCSGGDLFDRLKKQPDIHYTEAKCAKLVEQMLKALCYLHSKGIIHRDLKLENFLFQTEDPDSELHMIDFGLSKHFQLGEVLHEAVGTPYTVAPETIRGNYDERADVWAIGVITFLLLCGDAPFGGACASDDLILVTDNILSGRFVFEPEEAWNLVSEEGKDFVKTLLTVNPERRPTAKEARHHPWIQKWARKDRNDDTTRLDPKVVKALVSFKELSDVQQLFSKVLSYTLLPEQIAGLRQEFEKIDNGEGEITYSALRKVIIESAEAGSLGALTEVEIEEIFQALRIRNTETIIRWHEFIAGGLSQCAVDDRNLRLAFDRLDTTGKGFVTFDDIILLIGTDGPNDKETLQLVWNDATQQSSASFSGGALTYGDFVLLMQGQGEKIGESGSSLDDVTRTLNISVPIPEGEVLIDEEGVPFVVEDKSSRQVRSRSLGGAEKMASSNIRGSPASFVGPCVVKDDSQMPLLKDPVVHPAHHELRLAVLEAIKKFDEKRANRDKATLLVTQGSSSPAAVLIVRNGSRGEPTSVPEQHNASRDKSRNPGKPRGRKNKSC